MVIDVILVLMLATIVIVGYFLFKGLPVLRDRSRAAMHGERRDRPHEPFYLLEHRLHETESPEARSRPEAYAGQHATEAAAADHIALADDYKDDWHRRFASEPAARRASRTAEAPQAQPAAAVAERPVATAEPTVVSGDVIPGAAALAETPTMTEPEVATGEAGVVGPMPEGEMPVVVITEVITETIILTPEEGERPEEAA